MVESQKTKDKYANDIFFSNYITRSRQIFGNSESNLGKKHV
jgi:hypothetical protein